MMPFAPDPGILEMTPDKAVGGIIALLTAIGGWLEARRRYKKDERTQIQVAATTAESVAVAERNELLKIIKSELVEPLRVEVQELREEVDLLKKAKNAMSRAVQHLMMIIRKHDLINEVSEEIRKDIEEA
jgi:hypothetical protein